MNLIEQLGGYERAIKMSKEWESSIDGDIPLDTMMYSYDFGIFSWGDLQSALLEYRRQHNIFEVGDAVIRKQNGRLYYLIVDIDNDGQEFLIHHDKGAKFKDCRIFDNICNFKHATDAEIKAGRRL